ncbi:MAG: methyltransferase domain-containing protein [Erysipelotrichaceae bacterium]|nr:methyltransferase domain-containing protein [Erysipelotrichaceae bacterium]
MNTVWSDNIQGIMTLYLSRKLRFDEMFWPQYEKLFRIAENSGLRILEIGCGPGALTRTLADRYPKAQVIGLDRDSNFIAFARRQFPDLEFLEGDICALPFENESFDVVISNTVVEHVDPEFFWNEQLRVLKPGGICLCLSSRRGIRQKAECLKMTPEEKVFWDRQPSGEEELARYQVGRYQLTEAQLPKAMENYGFVNVTSGYAVIDLTPDDPIYPPEKARAMIEADRCSDLEAIRSVKDENDAEVIRAVNAKYDRRLALYEAGEKLWDCDVSIIMVARGEKK